MRPLGHVSTVARGKARDIARRVADATRWSRAPLGLGHARVVDLGSLPQAVADPSSLVTLDLARWTVFEHIHFADFTATAVGDRRPTSFVAIFSSGAVEHPLARWSDEVRAATPIPTDHAGAVGLGLRFDDGSFVRYPDPIGALAPPSEDPGHAPFKSFVELLAERSEGLVVELGSRARSGVTYRDEVAPHLDYLGIDVIEGPNVDIVGDAHDLGPVLEPASVDALFSIAVFEHLAMPWKVALEINRVLRPGGLVFVGTHQAYPIHDAPWDFWRFSDEAWHSLFNPATGFRVLETALGERARLLPLHSDASTEVAGGTAYLVSAVLAEKTNDTELTWPVSPSAVTTEPYPA